MVLTYVRKNWSKSIIIWRLSLSLSTHQLIL
jgi:hypothetical protein